MGGWPASFGLCLVGCEGMWSVHEHCTLWSNSPSSPVNLDLSSSNNTHGQPLALAMTAHAHDSPAPWEPLVLATWDDHDYGKNNSGADNPKKDESKLWFLKFPGMSTGHRHSPVRLGGAARRRDKASTWPMPTHEVCRSLRLT